MTSKQANTNSTPAGESLVLGSRISMFDKKGQSNFVKISKGPSVQVNKNKVNLPQFRINQHKGA